MKSPRDAWREQRAAWRRYERACKSVVVTDAVLFALSREYGRRHVVWLQVHTRMAAAKRQGTL